MKKMALAELKKAQPDLIKKGKEAVAAALKAKLAENKDKFKAEAAAYLSSWIGDTAPAGEEGEEEDEEDEEWDAVDAELEDEDEDDEGEDEDEDGDDADAEEENED